MLTHGVKMACGTVGRLVEHCTFNDAEMHVQSSLVSKCCLLEQDTSSALPQLTQANNEYQAGTLS